MTLIDELLSEIELARLDETPDARLLNESCGEGVSAFWSALLEDAALRGGELRSRPGRPIELYADAISRHVPSKAVALSVADAKGNFRHLSFAELDAAATGCASTWVKAGVEPGQVVALAMPMGISWLVAFATALRLGLVVSCLTSLGPHALARRSSALEADWIVVGPEGGPRLPEAFERSVLSVAWSGGGHAPPPQAYAPQQPVAKVFSPLRAPLERPALVSAETAWLLGLRDARCAYRVTRGDGLAMPGFSPLQYQPATILATLLAGARFVELPLAALERAPKLLAQPFVTSLGVSTALRDTLRRGSLRAWPELRAWWRSVAEPFEWTTWQAFIEETGLAALPGANLLVEAASGGALLISARRPGACNGFVLPAPGSPFALTELGTGSPSLARSGVFTKGGEPDAENPGWFLLVERGGEYLYAGTLEPRRAGCVYPERDVLEVVEAISGVDGAAIVPVATCEAERPWAFVLVVFAGVASETRLSALARELERRLRAEVHDDGFPDRVVQFPLYARRQEQKVDLDWCRSQYSVGFLQRKAKLAIYERLTALRASLKKVTEDVR